jgi:hypothetical protein
MLLKIAKHIANGKTVNLIESIADTHPSPSVRYDAFSSLVKLYPDNTEQIWDKATLDKSDYVRLLAKANLQQ